MACYQLSNGLLILIGCPVKILNDNFARHQKKPLMRLIKVLRILVRTPLLSGKQLPEKEERIAVLY